MRLSEAIRLGAMLRPQTFGTYSDSRGTCARGAANDAVGGSRRAAQMCEREWRTVAMIPSVACPANCGVVKITEANRCQGGAAMLVHLNDDHCWTREQIADWVESIEQQHEQQAAAVQPQPVTVSQQ